MKINRIELYNIGSYEGFNVFDIASQNLNGNIVVIGGKNGAGKTTMFTAIKKCLYGFKEAGYQALSASYKKDIKKLINDKSKAENDGKAYVLLDIDMLNGQEWDNYVLKRSWDLYSPTFEEFMVIKNGIELDEEEKLDFDNYLMNLLPPELFELYFFDGEQIADFFLEDNNNARIKNAFLTICGYDTFDIIYKNFQRVSKQQGGSDDPTTLYFEAEESLAIAEKALKKCDNDILDTTENIEKEDNNLISLEKNFRAGGGLSVDEWNAKLLEIKNEEKIREEKNTYVKNLVNDSIPYIILNRELLKLQEKMNVERDAERMKVLSESIFSVIPNVLNDAEKKYPSVDSNVQNFIMNELSKVVSHNEQPSILCLSQGEYDSLNNTVTSLINLNKDDIIQARKDIKDSISRGQAIRAELDQSNMDGVDSYLEEKNVSINRKIELVSERETLIQKRIELENELKTAQGNYDKASKELEKHFKTQSVTALTAKSILFLENLQKKLYDAEIAKVKLLFMEKMHQLMRKEQFIDRIEIDDDFNVTVYKKVILDVSKIKNKLQTGGAEAYRIEYGDIHCDDLLEKTGCTSLTGLLVKKVPMKTVEVLMKFDKSTMSKGEKQVFIMALYWSIMQLCNKEVPFIIDTPFARIDTEHREHITEHFFKTLRGQIFIFSTDEELTDRHMSLIGSDLGGKFLIENINNKQTSISAGKYFGD